MLAASHHSPSVDVSSHLQCKESKIECEAVIHSVLDSPVHAIYAFLRPSIKCLMLVPTQVTTALQEVDTIHRPAYEASPLISPSTRTENDNEVLIELKDVHKSFGNKKILRGVSIKIRRGETVGIIGGSGTGKSTTLRLMAGLLAPDEVQSMACTSLLIRMMGAMSK